MTKKRIDMTGMSFGRLTVVSLHSITSNGNGKWLCSCECGGATVSYRSNLIKGRTTSCGCYAKENMSRIKTTHGHSRFNARTRTYKSYEAMKERCCKPEHISYPNYGAIGVTVCERWLGSFEKFLEDMGERPKGTTLDRIDSGGNYEPANCRWATTKEQGLNRRNCRVWIVDGVRYESSRDAASALGVRQSVIHRWCRGYTSRHTGNHVPHRENCYTEARYVETSV